MKAGDYVLSAELIREDNNTNLVLDRKGKKYCLLLEIKDGQTEEISFTRWHGNETMLDLDIAAIRNSKIEVCCLHIESNTIEAAFNNGYQAVSWKAALIHLAT